MSQSRLQDPFMRELTDTFVATTKRLVKRLEGASAEEVPGEVEDELRGLMHGLLVIFDGGTALAERGLISIVDEKGWSFDRFLHEKCFDYWPTKQAPDQ